MAIDLNDPKMAGYHPLEYYQTTDDDSDSLRIRDTEPGRKKESLSIHPAQLDFGSVAANTTSPPQTILLVNNGYGPLTVSATTVLGDFLAAPLPTLEIQPGEIAEYQVSFAPKRVGAVIGGVYFNTGNAAGQEFIKLLGSGI
jgi:hypothetical protein